MCPEYYTYCLTLFLFLNKIKVYLRRVTLSIRINTHLNTQFSQCWRGSYAITHFFSILHVRSERKRVYKKNRANA